MVEAPEGGANSGGSTEDTAVPGMVSGRSDRGSGRRSAVSVRRRRLLALAGTAVTGGVAGCGNDADGTDTPLTPRTGDGVVTVMTSGLPKAFDFGPSLDEPSGLAHLEGFLQALVLPVDVSTGEYRTSGHAWTVDGRELSVPCLVDEFAVDGLRVELTFDDRFSYWNGEPLDGRAYHLRDRAVWLGSGNAFTDGSFDNELASATRYERTLEGEGANRFHARRAVHPGLPPLPPSVNRPWVERFEAASTEEALVDRFLEYISGVMHLPGFVAEGYGSGAYEVESPDDIRREAVESTGAAVNRVAVYASPRDDHPASPGVDRLRILTNVDTGSVVNRRVNGGAVWSPLQVPGSAASDGGIRGSVADPEALLGAGTGGLGRGVVGRHADIDPSSVPESVEQVATYPDPLHAGTGLVFNWNNDHLRRLWVRRALVAVAPFERIVRQTDAGSLGTPTRQTGLLSRTPESVFDGPFMESLHDYPLAADAETAAEWLRTAGYERPDAQWVGPDGEPLGFVLLAHGRRHLAIAETLSNALAAFGIATAVRNVARPFYAEEVLTSDFDIAVERFPGGWSPSDGYADRVDEDGQLRAVSPVTVFGNPLASCRDGEAAASIPGTVTLPAEPGGLRVEGVAYPDGGATYRWPDSGGVERSVCRAAERLHERGVDAETYRTAAAVCARWYNYAVPNVVFAQDVVGLWADTERLAVLAPDHPSMRVSRGAPVAPEHYHLQAGTFRVAVGE